MQYNREQLHTHVVPLNAGAPAARKADVRRESTTAPPGGAEHGTPLRRGLGPRREGNGA